MKKLFILLALVLVGCGEEKPPGPAPISNKEQHRHFDVSKFIAAITDADEIFVYEGLPHQSQRELYEAEVKRTDVVWFGAGAGGSSTGYPFYATPLDVPREEKERLTTLTQNYSGNFPLGGDLLKACGAYHPDYAIIWVKKGGESGSLICFGCGDWINFTPKERNYAAIDGGGAKELHAILAKYGIEGPKRKRG